MQGQQQGQTDYVNYVLMQGTVGEVESKQSNNGTPLTTFRIATQRSYTRSDGTEGVSNSTWRVDCWEGVAQSAQGQGIASGCWVKVEGYMSRRSFTNNQGEEQWVVFINADSVEVISYGQQQPQQQNYQQQPQQQNYQQQPQQQQQQQQQQAPQQQMSQPNYPNQPQQQNYQQQHQAPQQQQVPQQAPQQQQVPQQPQVPSHPQQQGGMNQQPQVPPSAPQGGAPMPSDMQVPSPQQQQQVAGEQSNQAPLGNGNGNNGQNDNGAPF